MAAVPGGAVRAALYLRLSRDDAGAGESVSIGGQRALLRSYAADHGWTVAGEYVDATDIIGLKQNPTKRNIDGNRTCRKLMFEAEDHV